MNVEREDGTPFAIIRFDPTGNVLAVKPADVSGAAAKIGPDGCETTDIQLAEGTGDACFDAEGGWAVVVLPDVGSFRIGISCGDKADLDELLRAIDLRDVAKLAPHGDDTIPSDGPAIPGCGK